jgi:DeoR/GlpR family transcriptional regulator of sugar metabolism
MARTSIILRVLIASPTDVYEERNIIQDSIYEWNNSHSSIFNLFYEPVRWETHVVSEMGDEAQKLINKQIVESSDIVIGVFWSKLGSPTKTELSGSTEEIKEFIKKKKPASIYFSKKDLPNLDKLDVNQTEKLREFKEFCTKNGIIGEFDSNEDLKRRIYNLLTKLSHDFLVNENELKKENVQIIDYKDKELLKENVSINKFESGRGTYITSKITSRALDKEKIAKYVANTLIKDFDSVFLDAGSTVEILAEELFRKRKFLSVLTNNIGVFAAYSKRSSDESISVNEFIFTGGRYDPMYEAVFGQNTLLTFHDFSPTIVIVGVSGLRSNEGVFCHGYEEQQVKRLIWQKPTERRIIVADWSKIGLRDSHKFGEFDEFIRNTNEAIIVTTEPSSDYKNEIISHFNEQINQLDKLGIKILKVG